MRLGLADRLPGENVAVIVDERSVWVVSVKLDPILGTRLDAGARVPCVFVMADNLDPDPLA